MIRFFKDHSKIISRLLLYQFGAAFLGIILSFVTAEGNNVIDLICSIFAILFYLTLIYMVMWEEGAKERIKIDGGRAPYRPFKGLVLSLYANVPNIIIAVMIFIGFIFGRKDGPFAYSWGTSIYAVFRMAAILWESMFNGIVRLYSPRNPAIFFLMIFPAIAVCTSGYYMGLNNKRIFGVFPAPPKKKKEKQDR